MATGQTKPRHEGPAKRAAENNAGSSVGQQADAPTVDRTKTMHQRYDGSSYPNAEADTAVLSVTPAQQIEVEQHLVAASDRVGAILATLADQDLLEVDEGLLVGFLADLNLEIWRARWALNIGTGFAVLRVAGSAS